jgi:hypothetical protein
LMSLLESVGLWDDGDEAGDQEIGDASVSTSIRTYFTV